MIIKQVGFFSSGSASLGAAVTAALKDANQFMANSPASDILDVTVQTMYEPIVQCEDGHYSVSDYYRHCISVVYLKDTRNEQ